MKKKTDAGYDIPEEDLREMREEEVVEELEIVDGQTGYCRFCGQAGIVHIVGGAKRTWMKPQHVNASAIRLKSILKAKKGCRRQSEE